MDDLRDWSSEAAASGMEKMSLSSTRSVSKFDNFQVAEDVTQGIIDRIHPTRVSEHRRAAVINYVKWLLGTKLGCEVISFGSVPLKTYLPDGDIDLIVFSGINTEEVVADNVFSVLDSEDRNGSADFIVEDVQLIRAEVKLVKCIIQNIVVDISFNQLGGLCTLCFLEKADNIIGKDHLLKRSILLIKAWCYYESRILGAHHGLLSTYGLETLVLYIFHLYHSSLDGPFTVLYKFLDFYSTFDWENYGVSLKGPVLLSSLPEIVVEQPGDSYDELLFCNDHLKRCIEAFSVPSMAMSSISQRAFNRKHLNIIDPLKENNNLGRSVSRGNYFRIKSAFAFGVQKLRVVSESTNEIASVLKEMFSNTMDRHKSGQRPDVQDSIPLNGHDFGSETVFSGHKMYPENQLSHQTDSRTPKGTQHSLNIVFDDKVRIYEEEKLSSRGGIEAPQSFNRAISDEDKSVDVASLSGRLCGDANDLATSKNPSTSDGTFRSPLPDGLECFFPTADKAFHAPHLYLSSSSTRLKENTHENLDGEPAGGLCYIEGRSDVNQNWDEERSSNEWQGSRSLSSPISWSSEDAYSAYPNIQASSSSLVPSNSLADLSGDYESQLINLQCARWFCECAHAAQVPSQFVPTFVPELQRKSSWDAVQRSVQKKQLTFSQRKTNGFMLAPPYNPMYSQLIQVPPFGVEGMRKTRGTGCFLNPSTNQYRTQTMVGRVRPQSLGVKSPNDDNCGSAPVDLAFNDRIPSLLEVNWKPYLPPLDLNDPDSHRAKAYPNGSIYHTTYEQEPEIGSSNGLNSRPLVPSHPRSSSSNPSASGTQRHAPSNGISQDRIAEQSYHLKNEDDFPPLPETAGKGP
ncbi:hypothetical protein SAY86_020994 [Trapa natans]|uniref:PAP/OAS1 substrate-binding domain superfamily n=1 Tax=Trapa natans TaxID=22666 RepID=A0AAN7REG3_TRANT|nr:hypothetical protein SAY86_020994 [Trapa natans]